MSDPDGYRFLPHAPNCQCAGCRQKDMRYPTGLPYWLGEAQPWACGRCGKDVERGELHPCPEICTVHGVKH